MEKAGAAVEHSLYVGDTYEADYVGATGAGMRCLLIDPQGAHDIDSAHRIDNILGLETGLRSLL